MTSKPTLMARVVPPALDQVELLAVRELHGFHLLVTSQVACCVMRVSVRVPALGVEAVVHHTGGECIKGAVDRVRAPRHDRGVALDGGRTRLITRLMKGCLASSPRGG